MVWQTIYWIWHIFIGYDVVIYWLWQIIYWLWQDYLFYDKQILIIFTTFYWLWQIIYWLWHTIYWLSKNYLLVMTNYLLVMTTICDYISSKLWNIYWLYYLLVMKYFLNDTIYLRSYLLVMTKYFIGYDKIIYWLWQMQWLWKDSLVQLFIGLWHTIYWLWLIFILVINIWLWQFNYQLYNIQRMTKFHTHYDKKIAFVIGYFVFIDYFSLENKLFNYDTLFIGYDYLLLCKILMTNYLLHYDKILMTNYSWWLIYSLWLYLLVQDTLFIGYDYYLLMMTNWLWQTIYWMAGYLFYLMTNNDYDHYLIWNIYWLWHTNLLCYDMNYSLVMTNYLLIMMNTIYWLWHTDLVHIIIQLFIVL